MLEAPDCQVCGACCFSPLERYVRVTGEDHARLLPDERERLTFFHGTRCYMRMEPTGLTEEARGAQALARRQAGLVPLERVPLLRCAALATGGGRYSCTVYERRPALCRELERGGPACDHDREARESTTSLVDGGLEDGRLAGRSPGVVPS